MLLHAPEIWTRLRCTPAAAAAAAAELALLLQLLLPLLPAPAAATIAATSLLLLLVAGAHMGHPFPWIAPATSPRSHNTGKRKSASGQECTRI
jgi:hypothetical protein